MRCVPCLYIIDYNCYLQDSFTLLEIETMRSNHAHKIRQAAQFLSGFQTACLQVVGGEIAPPITLCKGNHLSFILNAKTAIVHKFLNTQYPLPITSIANQGLNTQYPILIIQ